MRLLPPANDTGLPRTYSWDASLHTLEVVRSCDTCLPGARHPSRDHEVLEFPCDLPHTRIRKDLILAGAALQYLTVHNGTSLSPHKQQYVLNINLREVCVTNHAAFHYPLATSSYLGNSYPLYYSDTAYLM